VHPGGVVRSGKPSINTGADGKTVTLGGKGFGADGMRGGQGSGRGFRGGMMGPGSVSDSPAPFST